MMFKDILNDETKKKAHAKHKKAIEQYDGTFVFVQAECERLYQTRKRSVELIESIEDFLNSMTNTPQKFEPNLERINVEHNTFHQPENYAAEVKKEAVILGGGAAVGGAGGMAIAKMAPAAAMRAAITFGKTSTGKAISTLWGAAQNSAAKAWLGGGAKAIGGGGIVVGQARLDLAGPVGLIFAGVVIAGSLFVQANENKKTAGHDVEKANQASIAEEKLMDACTIISRIHSETEESLGRLSEQFKSLEPLKDRNYAELSDDEQSQLESLVNHTLVLTEMLNKVVE